MREIHFPPVDLLQLRGKRDVALLRWRRAACPGREHQRLEFGACGRHELGTLGHQLQALADNSGHLRGQLGASAGSPQLLVHHSNALLHVGRRGQHAAAAWERSVDCVLDPAQRHRQVGVAEGPNSCQERWQLVGRHCRLHALD